MKVLFTLAVLSIGLVACPSGYQRPGDYGNYNNDNYSNYNYYSISKPTLKAMNWPPGLFKDSIKAFNGSTHDDEFMVVAGKITRNFYSKKFKVSSKKELTQALTSEEPYKEITIANQIIVDNKLGFMGNITIDGSGSLLFTEKGSLELLKDKSAYTPHKCSALNSFYPRDQDAYIRLQIWGSIRFDLSKIVSAKISSSRPVHLSFTAQAQNVTLNLSSRGNIIALYEAADIKNYLGFAMDPQTEKSLGRSFLYANFLHDETAAMFGGSAIVQESTKWQDLDFVCRGEGADGSGVNSNVLLARTKLGSVRDKSCQALINFAQNWNDCAEVKMSQK